VAQLHLQAQISLPVASYDSQGWGGVIPAHRLHTGSLNLIILIIFGEEYKLRSFSVFYNLLPLYLSAVQISSSQLLQSMFFP
jgi:hypothetical protein